MTPSQDTVKKLRFLINDKDSKTFTDDELKMIIDEADCINCAASKAWMLKAMRYEDSVGQTTEYKTGEESYKSANIKDLVSVAYQNVDRYKAMCDSKKDIGSIMLGINTKINL